MDPKHYAHRFAQNFESYRLAAGLLKLLHFCLNVCGLGLAVFLRRDFGQRQVGWVNLWLAYMLLSFYATLGNMALVFTGHAPSSLMNFIVVAFLLAAGFHRYEIWRKNRDGVLWHSYYVGTSWLKLRCSQEMMVSWVEPGLAMLAGLLLWNFSGLVALWLIWSAAALWLHAQVTHYYEHQMVLDAVDAQLEARFLGDALTGKPATETGGVTIAESVRARVQNDPGVQAALAGLQPELRAMIVPVAAGETS